MTEVKISELPDGVAAETGDLVPASRGTTTHRIPAGTAFGKDIGTEEGNVAVLGTDGEFALDTIPEIPETKLPTNTRAKLSQVGTNAAIIANHSTELDGHDDTLAAHNTRINTAQTGVDGNAGQIQALLALSAEQADKIAALLDAGHFYISHSPTSHASLSDEQLRDALANGALMTASYNADKTVVTLRMEAGHGIGEGANYILLFVPGAYNITRVEHATRGGNTWNDEDWNLGIISTLEGVNGTTYTAEESDRAVGHGAGFDLRITVEDGVDDHLPAFDGTDNTEYYSTAGNAVQRFDITNDHVYSIVGSTAQNGGYILDGILGVGSTGTRGTAYGHLTLNGVDYTVNWAEENNANGFQIGLAPNDEVTLLAGSHFANLRVAVIDRTANTTNADFAMSDMTVVDSGNARQRLTISNVRAGTFSHGNQFDLAFYYSDAVIDFLGVNLAESSVARRILDAPPATWRERMGVASASGLNSAISALAPSQHQITLYSLNADAGNPVFTYNGTAVTLTGTEWYLANATNTNIANARRIYIGTATLQPDSSWAISNPRVSALDTFMSRVNGVWQTGIRAGADKVRMMTTDYLGVWQEFEWYSTPITVITEVPIVTWNLNHGTSFKVAIAAGEIDSAVLHEIDIRCLFHMDNGTVLQNNLQFPGDLFPVVQSGEARSGAVDRAVCVFHLNSGRVRFQICRKTPTQIAATGDPWAGVSMTLARAYGTTTGTLVTQVGGTGVGSSGFGGTTVDYAVIQATATRTTTAT